MSSAASGPASPRRLLVLGSSDTTGASLRDPTTESWPYLLRAHLADRVGPVEVTVRRFVPHVPGAVRYFEDQLTAYPADWVVLQATAYSVVHASVPYRVSRLLGQKRGELAEKWIRSFDRRTWSDGKPSALNRRVHRLGRRILPPAPQGQYRSLVDAYLQTITAMSRRESTWTAVVGTGVPQTSVVRDRPAIVGIVHSFNDELSAAAARHRIPWIDHDAALKESAAPDELFVDVVHRGTAWHERIAADVLNAVGTSS